MNKPLNILILLAVAVVLFCSCGQGMVTAGLSGGDTVRLRYAERLGIVKYDGFTVVTLADPWNEGKVLHTYVLVDSVAGTDGMTDDELVSLVSRSTVNRSTVTVVHTPLKRAVVSTSVHCGLLVSLGRGEAVRGVCDARYINQPYIRQRLADGTIADCGDGVVPDVEKIIDADADAVLVSPFQNSGGYGRLDRWGRPVIEVADYMETSALGRAEWMKFYGMLFGVEARADSLFSVVERNYKSLVLEAKKAVSRPMVIVDKVEGPVWYVPGGNSTLGRVMADANVNYAFADDKSSGSLQLTFEAVLSRAGKSDVWMYRYSPPQQASYASLLDENKGYSLFLAFQRKNVYACNTISTMFYDETPFRPDLLLREFIVVCHPDLRSLGAPRYYVPLK